MALNCGGRPPDPIQNSGYLLLKNSSGMNTPVAFESSQQVVTTTMFGSGSTALSNMQLTGSVTGNYVGSNSNDDYRVISIGDHAPEEGYTSSYEGGSNYSAPAVAPPLQVEMDHYYNHEMKALAQLQQKAVGGHYNFVERSRHIDAPAAVLQQLGSDHHRSHEVVERLHVQQQAAIRAYSHAGSSGHGGQGVATVPLHMGADHYSTHHDRELGSELQMQPASAENHRPYFEMSAAAMRAVVNLKEDADHHQSNHGRSTAALQMVVQMQGVKSDHHRENYVEREDNTEAVQQCMKMSPGVMMQGGEDQEGSMSMEDQGTGVYYGSSGSAGAGRMSSYMGDEQLQGPQGSMQQMMMNKKRRLTNEQVKSLEVSFERESKLEPERKNELAHELGLQPRQVAVWFQNRRARFKTKQLERDFDLLKHEYDAVRSHKNKLQAQVAKLKDLLDAQVAAGKLANAGTPANHIQGKGDMGTEQTSPASSSKKEKEIEARAGTRKQKATSDAEKQKATAKKKAGVERGDGLCSENSVDEAHAHAAAMAVDLAPKGSFTRLEVKPSLQVPHIIQQPLIQQQLPANTLSPPTKLSLCSPQQLFLHHMLAMKVDAHHFHLAHHEPHHNLFSEHYNVHSQLDHRSEDYKEDGNDSMICFNSTWHHDPS